jgi:iron complex outermembrane receptor protein
VTTRTFKLNPVASAALAAIFIAAVPNPSMAQQAGAAASDDSQTITVTARKRTEKASEVPLSISVVGGEEIKDRGAARLSEVAVPNVAFFGAENNALPNFSIRGVQTQNRVNIGFDSGIGVYVDGIYMGRTSAFNQETFDVERVEFLRGPQGTLFGKNSIAGAISVITRQPGKAFTATGSLDVGSLNQRRTSAYLSSPLGSDSVLGSISVYSGQRDGYMYNAATNSRFGNEDVTSIRGKLLVKPAKGLDVTVAVDRLEDKSVSIAGKITSGYGFIAGSGNFDSNVDIPTSAARKVQGVGLTMNYDLGNGLTLTSISSSRNLQSNRTTDTDGGPLNIVTTGVDTDQSQWSQELRIATNRAQAIEYVAGLYMYEQKASSSSRSTFGPGSGLAPIRNTTGNTFGNIDSKTWAGFANVDYNLNSNLTLTGGMRYTKETKNLDYQQVVTFPSFLGAPNLPREQDSLSTSNMTPLVSLRYKLDRSTMMYATYSKGFRSGGWNVDNVATTSITSFKQTRFGDESMDSYELGTKASLAGGLMSLSAAVFQMNYTDLQVTQLVPVLGGGGAVVGIVTNGGDAKVKGTEIELGVRPAKSLRLSGSLGVTDAKYTDYVDKTRAGAPLVFTGNRLNFAPRLTSTLSGVYTLGTALGSLAFRMDYTRNSEYYIGRENLASQLLPGKSLINGRVTLAADSGKWEIAGYVNNLQDKLYIVGQGPGGFAAPVGTGTNMQVNYGRPRSVGLVATVNF